MRKKLKFMPPGASGPAANHRGMLIPMVLIGMFIFVIFFFTLMKWNSANRRMNMQDIQGRKAFYLARGGIQMALLKVSLLPTECYDALAISQLKNPYFSFKNGAVNPDPKAADYNPGPKYLVKKGEDRKSLLSDVSLCGEAGKPLSGSLNAFIKAFTEDIGFSKTSTSGTVNPVTDNDKIVERVEPYRHGFCATKVKVLAVEGQQLYNRQTVEFTVKGWVYDFTGMKKEKEVNQIIEVERTPGKP